MSTPAIFYVSDILQILFEYLAPYNEVYYWNKLPLDFYRPNGRSCFRDVSQFGLTCVFIYDHALDYLWYHLHDLKQILRILPTFEVIQTTDGQGKHFLNGPIQAEHWSRLELYARRVKRAYCGRDGIDLPVFDELFYWCKGRGIFPNLEQLEWEEESFIHKEPLLFVTPSLTHFTLEWRRIFYLHYTADSRDRSEADELLVIESLIECVPDLQHLYFESITISLAAINLTTRLNKLEGIAYYRLNHQPKTNSESELGGLDDLPISTHLALPESPEECKHFSMDNSLFEAFPQWQSLRFLALNVNALDCSRLSVQLKTLNKLRLLGNASAKASFLQSLHAPHLRIVEFYDEDPDIAAEDWTNIQLCMEIIGARFADTVVAIGYLRHIYKHLGPAGVSVLCLIRPLLPLSNLQDLKIYVGDDICLTDDGVRDLFISCPKLRCLIMSFIAGTFQPTPRCIKHAVMHAPQLVKWRFGIDFSGNPVESLRALQVTHPSIRNLHFMMQQSSMELDLDDVAMEIFRIFPFLDVRLVVFDDFNVLWGKVLRKVAQLQGTVISCWEDN
ncbi:hypothetical protein ABKN59_010291 [Abortiporus biennis]